MWVTAMSCSELLTLPPSGEKSHLADAVVITRHSPSRDSAHLWVQNKEIPAEISVWKVISLRNAILFIVWHWKSAVKFGLHLENLKTFWRGGKHWTSCASRASSLRVLKAFVILSWGNKFILLKREYRTKPDVDKFNFMFCETYCFHNLVTNFHLELSGRCWSHIQDF